MRDSEIRDLVNESVARAVAAKDAEIAGAIAEGLRVYADRPVGEKGSPSLQYGIVEQVESTFAYVTLDGQTDAVPINMLGGLVEGERVAVLLVPPSGNLAIGMVQPAVVGSLPPGGAADQVLTKIDAVDGNADWETPSAGGGFPVGPEDDGTSTAEITHSAPGGGAGVLFVTQTDDAVGTNVGRLAVATSASDVETGILSSTGITDAAFVTADVNITLGQAKSEMGATYGAGSDGKITVESSGGTSIASMTADKIHFPFTSSDAGFGINVESALPTADPATVGQLWMDPLTFIVMVSQG